jgi:predicted glycosyltransferase
VTNSTRQRSSRPRSIWIDLDNTPHVPFFAPIIDELERRGYSLTLTARDAYQTCELADFFKVPYTRVGRHFGKRRALKFFGAGLRTAQLLPIALEARPDLAVAHGSGSQVLAAGLLGIPSLAIFDYEFSRLARLGGPTWVMVPDVMSDAAVRFDPRRVLRYPGLKEDVYAEGFTPDASIRSELGLTGDAVVVTVRPPASEAHYHGRESDDLFAETMRRLGEARETTVVLLPRNRRQEMAIRKAWPGLLASGRFIVPDRAVHGMNLIWHSDLVISGGGTMNREAAALGVPVYSIFGGRIGDVDRSLAARGRLVLVEGVGEVRTKILLERRTRPLTPGRTHRATLSTIANHIASLADGTRSPARPAA